MPPEQLLQAFKTAALSVTNLYKSAAADQNNSRAAGYQDALDDLLRFLDSNNLGLQDGEGWRVRQWATERYDHSTNHASSDTEDPKPAATEMARDDAREDQESASNDTRTVDDPREANQREATTTQRHHRHDSAPPLFRFTAGLSNQGSDDMQVNDEPTSPQMQAEASSPPPIQVQVVNRTNRAAHRNSNSRHGRPVHRPQSSAAGAKRKLQQVPDFFDISNINFKDDQEGGASGKRSRLA